MPVDSQSEEMIDVFYGSETDYEEYKVSKIKSDRPDIYYGFAVPYAGISSLFSERLRQ